jgi:hypothetical protein
LAGATKLNIRISSPDIPLAEQPGLVPASATGYGGGLIRYGSENFEIIAGIG